MKRDVRPTSLLIATVGASIMVIAVVVGSVWILQLPFIAKHIPTFEPPVESSEPTADAAPDTAVATVTPTPRFQPDCEAMREVLEYRIQGARGCQDSRQCGLSAPRERCLTAFGIGLRAPIETAILEFNAQCADAAPIAALDDICRSPTTEWQPACVNNLCVLREIDAPWIAAP